MAAIDALAEPAALELRPWRIRPTALSWRQLLMVALIALLLSTQVFFQSGIGELLASGEFFAGWLQYLAEALACAISMWLAMAAFERFVDLRGVWRFAAAGGTLFAAALVAECVFSAFAPGFFPPWRFIAADALRWVLWGGIVYAAHGHAQRHAGAALLLANERVERERADQRRAEANLQLLQAQIQPHFLFNLFAHVRRLYRVRHEEGRHAIERLRSYLKEVLGAIGGRDTTVARELELVRAYLELMQVGLGDRLSFFIEAAPGTGELRIPPLAVLTLVENAVKHGVARASRPGVVHVAVRRDGGTTRIEVRDDGDGHAPSSGSGVGLANTKARLSALYGTRAQLSLDAAPGRGAVAAIEIAAA